MEMIGPPNAIKRRLVLISSIIYNFKVVLLKPCLASITNVLYKSVGRFIISLTILNIPMKIKLCKIFQKNIK